MSTGGGDGTTRSGEMTLAFSLDAIERFDDPVQVFADARQWSQYVGIVANDADAVDSFVDDHAITQDFELGDRDKWLIMEQLRATGTPRHVFVGADVEDRRIADQLGWEFKRPVDVAEKADWTLADESGESGDDTGIVGRVVSRLLE